MLFRHPADAEIAWIDRIGRALAAMQHAISHVEADCDDPTALRSSRFPYHSAIGRGAGTARRAEPRANALDLRNLRYFVRIADLGSITRASAELGVAQPALSRSLKAMEDELGTPLLVRLPRGVRLTGAGRQFLDHARRVLREFARARAALRDPGGPPRGRVILGISPTLAPLLGAPAVERAQRQCPDVTLKLVEAFSTQLQDALLAGRLDVAVLTNPPPARALAYTPLASEPIVVLTAPQRRDTGRFLSVAELARTPVVTTESIRAIADEQLARHGARVEVQAEIDSIEVVRRLALRGACAALLPVSTLYEDIRAGRVVPFQVADANVHRMLVLAQPAGRESPAADEIAQVVVAEVHALIELGIFSMPVALSSPSPAPPPARAPNTSRTRKRREARRSA
jgi:LysR family nitrogen assimilation transcriptional regulator